jgi:NAD(P)H-dependent flavin oxidoreductase YrpB (nitropropane dioxygenase family)
MIESRLCSKIGIKYPIIQGGMGPFGTNKLCIAASNAGILGLISSSGMFYKNSTRQIYEYFCRTGGAAPSHDEESVLRTIFQTTLKQTRAKQGVFGVNVLVSEEMMDIAKQVIGTAIKIREEDPEMRQRFKVLVTSAGDPLPWTEVIKKTDLVWMHVVPSVKAALRCKKAGVDVIIASGHEGGFHVAWEPLHTMVLLPAVAEAVSDDSTLVVGAGGICDGRTLAAALMLGADGVQMGTRFLATYDSDFHQMWKEGVVSAGDRGSLVARGFVGPARWLKTPRSEEHARNTLTKSPGVFLGVPDDYTTLDMSLINFENESFNALYSGDEKRALFAAGESVQRIADLPRVSDLVQRIVTETELVIKSVQIKIPDPQAKG